MSTQIRLLPAVIGATAVLLSLRLGAIAFGEEGSVAGVAVANAEEHPPAPTPAAPAETPAAAPAAAEAPSGAAPAATTTPATPAAPADPATAATAPTAPDAHPAGAAPAVPTADSSMITPQTKGEAEVLQSLSARRVELEQRERELSLREQLLNAAEQRVNAKVAELKDLQVKLDALLAQRDEQQDKQYGSLVKMYESMKPGDAAKIFDKLDRQILVDVAGRMKPAKIGAVVALMDPLKAQELTVLLAARLAPPTAGSAAPVAPAAPAPVAAPPETSGMTPIIAPPTTPAEPAPTPAAATAPATPAHDTQAQAAPTPAPAAESAHDPAASPAG